MSLPECDGCTSFVNLWAEALGQELGGDVSVTNRAIAGAEAPDVLDLVQTSETVREGLRNAGLVVISLGINDTPWNRLDDPCHAAARYPVIEWRKITGSCISRVAQEYRATLGQILDVVDDLHGDEPFVLRVVTVYNAVIGDKVDPSWDDPAAVAPSITANKKFAQLQCELARLHHGQCVDALRALNGDQASAPADKYLASDHTHLNPVGHALIAELLLSAGHQPGV